ncbi:hypothetical protein LP417_35145 (plasmid) [Polaromonas sp. P1-6]|nr:hypothetical protein LP417_35145 [Polaromonas sp. P1-6]
MVKPHATAPSKFEGIILEKPAGVPALNQKKSVSSIHVAAENDSQNKQAHQMAFACGKDTNDSRILRL